MLLAVCQLVVQDRLGEAAGQPRGARAEDCRLVRHHELRELPPREALRPLGDIFQKFLVQRLVNLDLLPPLRRLVDVLLHEALQHPLPLRQRGQRELEGFVDAIEHRAVEGVADVGGDHDGELIALRPCVVEEGGQHVACLLAHRPARRRASARPQEGVRLIDEQDEPPPGGVCPSEELVQLMHRVFAEGPDVAAGHDGVVEA
mmetsp:Transcript_50639/g.127572  ORF Transcript_50639/g.127572 Transcript_50639/m.127572 type:complete len:203 (+) Transcript_50639:135-743(+)